MNGAAILGLIRSVEPTSYSRLVEVRFRGDGDECWRLSFPVWGGMEHVDFKPSGDKAADAEELVDLTCRHAIEYLTEFRAALRGAK